MVIVGQTDDSGLRIVQRIHRLRPRLSGDVYVSLSAQVQQQTNVAA